MGLSYACLLIAACLLVQVASIKFIDIEPKVKHNSSLVQSVTPDITNGNYATPGQFPYQVGLMLYVKEGAAWCGGSIITNRHILTAAHCTDPVTTGVDVYLGAWNIRDMTDKNMQIIYVPRNSRNNYITVHEDWNMATLSNDISIIKLPVKIYFNEFIQPANLPPLGSEPDYTGQYAIASGWGKTKDSDQAVADILHWVEVPIMALKTCKRYFLGQVKDYQVCIKTSPDRTSTCQGDSGGPLVLADGSTTVIGLTSFGISLGCEIGFPAVFTSTYHFGEWIRKVAGITN